jgi:membrane protein required for colicin V production
METYDLLMLIVLVAATLFGAIKGFAWQLASLGSIAISYVAAYRFREPFSQMIKADPPWNRLFAMLLIYLGTSFLIWMIFRMVSRSIDKMKLKEFDRQVGALFGFGKGVLYCSLVTLFAVTLLGPSARQKIVSSRSGFYISKFLDRSRSVMPPEVSQVVRPYLDRFEQEMQNGGGGLAWPVSTSDRVLPESLWNGSGGAGGGLSQFPQIPQGFDPQQFLPNAMR